MVAVTVVAGTPAAGDAQSILHLGLNTGVTFAAYPDMAKASVVLHRMLSPLAEAAVNQMLAKSRKRLAEQSVDLSRERFLVYLPPKPASGRYGVLAFVPPWEDAKMPTGWAEVLDRLGLIYVSAERSGNSQNVLARRTPLAIIGAADVIASYPVDPARVYIGGFSGGARTALRIAVAYPDLFPRAVLNAGSDPIGSPPDSPSPDGLFAQFQTSTRLLHITGEFDGGAISAYTSSADSLRTYCVRDPVALTDPGVGHTAATPSVLLRGLLALDRESVAGSPALSRCRDALAERMRAALANADASIGSGAVGKARGQIIELDRHFGGLAEDAIVALAVKCGCGLLEAQDAAVR